MALSRLLIQSTKSRKTNNKPFIYKKGVAKNDSFFILAATATLCTSTIAYSK